MAQRLRDWIFATFVAFILALSAPVHAPVHAQEPAFVALEAGQPAPHAGLLILDDVAVRWRQEIERLRFEIGLNEQRIASMRLAHDEAIAAHEEASRARLALHDELWGQRATDLREAAEQARRERDEARRREGPRWYQRPGLWFALGAGAAGALAIVVSR